MYFYCYDFYIYNRSSGLNINEEKNVQFFNLTGSFLLVFFYFYDDDFYIYNRRKVLNINEKKADVILKQLPL